MRKIITFLFIFFVTTQYASELPSIIRQDETEIIEQLVEMTKSKLESQERLLQLITQFKKTRSQFIEDPNSKKLATALVRTSQKIEQEIIKNHIAHLFDEQFLKEIRFFAQVGSQSASKNLSAPS